MKMNIINSFRIGALSVICFSGSVYAQDLGGLLDSSGGSVLNVAGGGVDSLLGQVGSTVSGLTDPMMDDLLLDDVLGNDSVDIDPLGEDLLDELPVAQELLDIDGGSAGQ